MIHKNVQLGTVKGVTMIQLGKGDVKVAFVKSPNEKYSGVQFVNDTTKPIGTKEGNTIGTTTDDSAPQVMITFTDIKSIEVVERALNKAKIWLRNQ